MNRPRRTPAEEGGIRDPAVWPGDEHAILAGVPQGVPVGAALARGVVLAVPGLPLGIHCFLGVLPSGAVVSQFAGIPRRVQVGAGGARLRRDGRLARRTPSSARA